MDFGGSGSLLTPTGCDAESARLTSIRLAKSALRRGVSKADLRDVLEACGLAEPLAQGLSVHRDSYGRVRTDQAPAPSPGTESAAAGEPEAVAVPAGQHGHNGRCASGDHLWIPENIWATASGKNRCGRCEQRRKRRGPSRKPKDPNAPVLCKCPGRKHVLTAETSESTYVDPRGQRQCRAGIERRKQAEQVLDPLARTLNPGERLCRCPDEKHVLTPYQSDTTYISPQGKRECRVARARNNAKEAA